MGERLPPDNRTEGDLLLVLSTTAMMPKDPSAVSSSIRPTSGTAAWATGGADCVAPSDATMATSNPAGLVAVAVTSAWASGGMDCAAPLDATAAASNYAWLVRVGDDPATSSSVRTASGAIAWATGGTDCAALSDTTVAVSGYSWLGAVMATSTGDTGPSAGGIAPAMEDAACSATTEGAGTAVGTARSANEATASAPLLPKIGAMSGSAIHPA
ncbi:uncharacterized protein [Miscanthus floridulus]|uniref:uncharacterized protein n=1 Tax=Miscanthus floridulus TaxID=154761 RepID=UPI00345AF7F5